MFRRVSAMSLVVLFALGALPASAQQATPAATTSNTMVVTNLNDSGSGSLSQAIDDAPDGATITFTPGLHGTIEHGGGAIRRSLTIIGPGPKSSDLVINSGGFGINPNHPGTITVNLTMFTITDLGNTASSGYASGISSSGYSVVNISNVTFQDNNERRSVVTIGVSSVMTIANSAFLNNSTELSPGVIDNAGKLTVINSTFQNNEAIAVDNGDEAIILHSTFQDTMPALISPTNRPIPVAPIQSEISAKTSLQNTIVAAPAGKVMCLGTIIDGGGNLQFPNADCGATIPVGDPKLVPPQDNGGPTWTMALLPSSAAISKLSGAQCPASDQRGFALPTTAGNNSQTCDIGAFQTVAASPTAVATASASTPAQ